MAQAGALLMHRSEVGQSLVDIKTGGSELGYFWWMDFIGHLFSTVFWALGLGKVFLNVVDNFEG